MPRPHFTPRKEPVPILQEAGWVPGQVWTGGKSRHHRDSIPDHPARSQSLYRLSYPAHNIYIYTHSRNYSCCVCPWTLLLVWQNNVRSFQQYLPQSEVNCVPVFVMCLVLELVRHSCTGFDWHCVLPEYGAHVP